MLGRHAVVEVEREVGTRGEATVHGVAEVIEVGVAVVVVVVVVVVAAVVAVAARVVAGAAATRGHRKEDVPGPIPLVLHTVVIPRTAVTVVESIWI